jgi:glucosamine-6-phosphate deaminase
VIVLIKTDYTELSREAAGIVAAAIRKNPCLTLGLPTGSTPLGMYSELIRYHREGLDLSGIQTFNMDEYVGVDANSPESYRSYMFREFFDHVNVPAKSIHIPAANPGDGFDAEAMRYEKLIRNAGGLDLQISGIGVNGHIGFNEPGSGRTSRTRVVRLADSTREGMRRYFVNGRDMPRSAITIGVGTIMEARAVVLLASGIRKAGAVAGALEGPVTTDIPASALQRHPHVTVILDQAAASMLKRV